MEPTLDLFLTRVVFSVPLWGKVVNLGLEERDLGRRCHDLRCGGVAPGEEARIEEGRRGRRRRRGVRGGSYKII